MASHEDGSTRDDAVLILTRNAILAMDLGDALVEAGLAGQPAYQGRVLAKAVIVDLDQLDRRTAAIVRRHAKANVPVVAIAPDDHIASRITGRATEHFVKPVLSDVVVRKVCELLTCDR